MSSKDLAVSVRGLSKSYVIAHNMNRPTNLRETIVDRFRHPLGNGGQDHELFWAIKNMDFDIRAGEVVGIIGRNGAGKSTLLKILSRTTWPTTGEIDIHGRVSSLLEVGTGFHPELTGRENIYLNGTILGMSRREIGRKFDEIVAFSGVEKFIDTPVKRYSSGMYVRLAFAVAAHLDSEMLIVDEVLAVGDVAFQEKCLGQMQRNASHGRTILFISHNMASIQQLCNRCIWLKSGELVADGSPRDVVREYLSSMKERSNTSVRDWEDRETNGQARILSLEAVDPTDGTNGCVHFGGTLRLSIEAEFYEPVVDPGFGVMVHTIEGEPILDIRSSHAGYRMKRVQGRVKVHANVERVGLHPGEYLLSPWTSDAACKQDLDWVKHCCTLQVHPAPGPAGVIRLYPEWGKYWIPSAWSTGP